MASKSDETAPVATPDGQSVGNPESQPAPGEGADPVEAALAVALERASLVGQWTVVEVLARELEARRKARSGVVDMAQARAKRRE
jgi:ribulose 1,5-bisphosphate carboxylase large subunit-like protein